MTEWLMENEVWEWVFSGIGVALLGWLVARLRHSKKDHAGSRTFQIRDSQAGVVGDNASVGGDINMGNRFSVRAVTVQGVVRADRIGNLTQKFGKLPGDE